MNSAGAMKRVIYHYQLFVKVSSSPRFSSEQTSHRQQTTTQAKSHVDVLETSWNEVSVREISCQIMPRYLIGISRRNDWNRSHNHNVAVVATV